MKLGVFSVLYNDKPLDEVARYIASLGYETIELAAWKTSSYLDIERARFEERLLIDIDVPPELRGIRVPALLIQPLVENAIKHGIANSRSGGRVSIE